MLVYIQFLSITTFFEKENNSSIQTPRFDFTQKPCIKTVAVELIVNEWCKTLETAIL